MGDITREQFEGMVLVAARKLASRSILKGIVPMEELEQLPPRMRKWIVQEANKLMGIEDNPDLKGF